jgi:serine/threonine protein kinase
MRDASRAAETYLAKYEVLRPLATGGMAEIFLARTRDSGRLVVIKKLHPRLAIESEYVQMFRDEAVIASKLQHPNLVEVYELGLDGEEHYIAMEYLHGHDLSRTLRRMRNDRVPLMFQQAIAIVRDIAAGLHYAHERVDDEGNLLNIIHRDISPHNVILTYSGEVKVLDFGIAKANSQVARTRTGVLKGKAAYMSPEQALGEPLDRRTDVFSIGILLWELTTGRWLYRRRSELETLKAVVESDAPRPSTLRADYPKDLESIVMKALEREPANRWSTAGELRAALDDIARRWRFRPTRTTISKLMATVFADQVEAWDAAREAGQTLADHLATAKPEVVEPSDDTFGTDPEELVALETRRAPQEASEVSRTRPAAPTQPMKPLPPKPWWQRHSKVLVAALIVGAIAGAGVAIVAALSGSGTSRPPGRPLGAPSGNPIETETLDIKSLPRPDDRPPPSGSASSTPTQAPDSATGSGQDSKVPIVYPPPMPGARKSSRTPERPGARTPASEGSSASSQSSPPAPSGPSTPRP